MHSAASQRVQHWCTSYKHSHFCLFLAPPRLRLRAAADDEVVWTGRLPRPAAARYDTTCNAMHASKLAIRVRVSDPGTLSCKAPLQTPSHLRSQQRTLSSPNMYQSNGLTYVKPTCLLRPRNKPLAALTFKACHAYAACALLVQRLQRAYVAMPLPATLDNKPLKWVDSF